MENIKIEGTENSPDVDFDFQANIFTIQGICYPENPSVFFKSIVENFAAHLESLNGETVEFNFRMTYFNSSSARVIFRIFDLLEDAAKQGNIVSVIWHYLEDDDTMADRGEDYGDDLEIATFKMMPFPE